MEDAYLILGIMPGASKKIIKSAYRKMAKRLHPDVNKSPDAEEKFKKVQQAYEFLINVGLDSPASTMGYTHPLPQDWVEIEKVNIFHILFGKSFAHMFNTKKR